MEFYIQSKKRINSQLSNKVTIYKAISLKAVRSILENKQDERNSSKSTAAIPEGW